MTTPLVSSEPDIRIFREPLVYLVGRQTMTGEGLDQFLRDHGVAWETDTEVAGEHLLEVGHGSVLEHAVWNFIIAGVSRSFTHELVRHRAGFGYSQLSQRYVDESVAEYVEPDVIAGDPELHGLWLDTVARTHQAYVELAAKLQEKFKDEPDRTLRRKLARQAARSVLPNATETKIFVTANARALRHFIEMRASRHAEPEIRKVAVAILRIMQKEAPNLFGDYELHSLPDGSSEASTPHRKV